MHTFKHDGIYIDIDPRDSYVDSDAFIVAGYVFGDNIEGRLVGVVDSTGFDYAIEALTDDGTEGQDLDYRLPEHVYHAIFRMGRRVLARRAA